jgi:acyl-coenzyme A synthetase/AMP-(fatty) acid ligase
MLTADFCSVFLHLRQAEDQRYFAGCTAVCVAENAIEVNGSILAERLLPILDHFDVTHLLATPSLLLRLAELPSACRHLRALRYVASSGDALMQKAAQLIAAVLPRQAAFVSFYGCTETCADALCYDVRAGVTSLSRPRMCEDNLVWDLRLCLIPLGLHDL